MNKNVLLTAALVAAALLGSCSNPSETSANVAPEAKKEPPAAPVAITARKAFLEMYKSAYAWAPDLQTLSLKCGSVPNVKNEDGRAGMWTAIFVSPSKREARTLSYAVADTGTDIRKGINVSHQQSWSGPTAASKSFSNAEFAVDSDAAYKVASAKATAWLKTHQDAKPHFTLGYSSRYPTPVWHILWGTADKGYVAYVNAVSGELYAK